jgi:hypothetical protein
MLVVVVACVACDKGCGILEPSSGNALVRVCTVKITAREMSEKKAMRGVWSV